MAKICSGILMFLLLQIQTTLLVAAIEAGCDNCGCCVNRTCATRFVDGHDVTEYCTHGCITGIWGNKCYSLCNVQCVTCTQRKGNVCTSCMEGKYLSAGKCLHCNVRCKLCTSAAQCQECKDPYYNAGDRTDCSLSCPENCLCQDFGVCSSCKNGFYNINNECQNTCPNNCKTCISNSNCQSCKDGFYIGNNNEARDCSLHCPDRCSTCTSSDKCTHCHTGRYGNICQCQCSRGCVHGQCSIVDGTCSCNDWFTGNKCDDCELGRYGEDCDKICSSGCKYHVCERTTGRCTECKSTNIVGDFCNQCVDGKWGTDCNSECPMHCGNGGVCQRYSGNCDSCQSQFRGVKCDKCVVGYYGSKCKQACPNNCKNSICHQSNGTCLGCIHNFAGPSCNECAVGLYGLDCNIPCSFLKCPGNICNKDTGNCVSCPEGFYGSLCELNCSPGCINRSCDIDGSCLRCLPSYSGDKCCIENGHCQLCSSNTNCELCDEGYYGEECNKPCSTTCDNSGSATTCDKASGTCLTCMDGFYGDMCNFKCSVLCLNNRCLKDNGHCTEGCVNGFEGPTCDHVTKDVTSVIGKSVGISSAIMVVLTVVTFILLRRCGFVVLIRKQRALEKQAESTIEPSYKNTELQPVSPQSGHSDDVGEYERLGERKQGYVTVYEQI